MGRGSADEAILVVKLSADEDAVTYLRIKLIVSCMDAGGEGWNMIPSLHILKQLMLQDQPKRSRLQTETYS